MDARASGLLHRGRRNGEPASVHRVWRLPADVDTDALAPSRWMKYSAEVIARHCLESVRPQLALEARRGDVIVAGAAILVEVMRRFGFERTLVSETDILDGLALEMLGVR